MSDSGLKIPTTTELEGRVREALKVARRGLAQMASEDDWAYEAIAARNAIINIIRILEDGRS